MAKDYGLSCLRRGTFQGWKVPKDPRACWPGPEESSIGKVFRASGAQALVPILLFPGLRPWMVKN